MTSLQHAHNWTAKNDRNKMSFWLDVLFDEESGLDDPSAYPVMLEFRPGVAKLEVQHWLERNSRMCDKAVALLRDYHENRSNKPPGPLAPISPLAWNWLPKTAGESRADDLADDAKVTPSWDENETDKFKQDAGYARVSREIDTWWLSARDPNYEDWVVPMPSVEFAKTRTDHCKANLIRRYNHCYRGDEHDHDHDHDDHDHDDRQSAGGAQVEGSVGDEAEGSHHHDQNEEEYDDPIIEEEEEDDDDSYGEGPMTGLLTEVPNILDPKQIEALHMIVKSCILDSAGVGLTKAGENLQKTRCRMFLAADCGKSLLREMLVFIAVWEQPETSLIFQITTQIIEAIHHSALLPYTWDSLRIPKDIISPAQTVLLRLINHMFQARKSKAPASESKEQLRDVKLVYFLFASFRSRVVPECVALMHLQAQIRQGLCDPADFPVDNWDMERAKDGLAQFLDFLMTVVEMEHIRKYLVEWEVAYELITLLKALEAGVAKKELVSLPDRSANRPNPVSPTGSNIDHQHWDISHVAYPGEPPVPPPPPPVQDPAHLFAWPQIKIQILTILAGLLQPPPGRSGPGNPHVQHQIVENDGMLAMLNCCAYDDHNPYAKERVQICLKWLMDGSKAANDFVRDMVAVKGPPQSRPYGPTPPPGQQPQPQTEAPKPASLAAVAAAQQTGPSPPQQVPRPADQSAPSSTRQPNPRATGTKTLRIDGIAGEVKIQFSQPGPTTAIPTTLAPNPATSSSTPPAATTTTSSSKPHQPQPPPPPPPTLPISQAGGPLNLSGLLAAGLGAGINGSVLGAGIARLAAAGLISSDPASQQQQREQLAALQQHLMAAAGGAVLNHAAAASAAASAALGSSSSTSSSSGGGGGSGAGGNGSGGGGVGGNAGNNGNANATATAAARSRSEELLRDIVALADEAARLALGHHAHAHWSGQAGGVEREGDETEEEEFM